MPLKYGRTKGRYTHGPIFCRPVCGRLVPDKFQTGFFVGDRDCVCLIQKRWPIKKKSVRVFLFPDKLSASKYWELPDKKSAHVALRIATKYFALW